MGRPEKARRRFQREIRSVGATSLGLDFPVRGDNGHFLLLEREVEVGGVHVYCVCGFKLMCALPQAVNNFDSYTCLFPWRRIGMGGP